MNNLTQLFSTLSEVTNIIEQSGFTYEFIETRKGYNAIIKQMPGYIKTEQFSKRKYELLPDNFLMSIIKFEDRPVASLCARLDRLGKATLWEQWQQQQGRVYGGKLGNNQPPIIFRVTGSIAYQGETYVSQEFRGQKLAQMINLLSHLGCFVRFNPDYIYGFMRVNLIHSGYPAKCGIGHIAPFGTDWKECPPGINADDYIVWNPKEDVVRNCNLSVRYI